MHRMRSRDGGFTLVEVMIGMAIIVFALFAVLSTTVHTNTTKEAHREMEVAKEAAMRKIEEIRGLPWGSFTSPVIPSVVNTYAGGTFPAFPVDGLLADPGDTAWTSSASNPKKQGKGQVIIHGTNPTPIADPVLLIDYEILIEWKGIRGESRYSCRMMLAKDQGK